MCFELGISQLTVWCSVSSPTLLLIPTLAA